MQIVWLWKKSAIGQLPKPILIVEIFWIDFSICLNCTLFVDLDKTVWKFDLILLAYLSFKKINPIGAGSLGIKIKSLRLKLILTYFCQKMISFSYYT